MDYNRNSRQHVCNKATTDSEFAFSSLEAVRKTLLGLSGRNQRLSYKHPRASCVRAIDELPDSQLGHYDMMVGELIA